MALFFGDPSWSWWQWYVYAVEHAVGFAGAFVMVYARGRAWRWPVALLCLAALAVCVGLTRSFAGVVLAVAVTVATWAVAGWLTGAVRPGAVRGDRDA